MNIVDNFIIISLIVLAFVAGMKLSDRYHRKAEQDTKDALEKQFLRLRARADADDPCRPYIAPRSFMPVNPPVVNTGAGDFDGDGVGPISQEFVDELKTTGKAKTSFRKSSVSK